MSVPKTFEQYDAFVHSIAVGPARCFSYCGHGLAEEAGEVNGKIKRHFRGDGNFDNPKNREAALLECGDTLWYLTALAQAIGSNLQEIVDLNIKKLTTRHAEGKVLGSGDKR